jgi:hypothetical protein
MAAKKKMVLIDVAAIGKKGGEARAAGMSAAERSESARKAVQARWAKAKKAEGHASNGHSTDDAAGEMNVKKKTGGKKK